MIVILVAATDHAGGRRRIIVAALAHRQQRTALNPFEADQSNIYPLLRVGEERPAPHDQAPGSDQGSKLAQGRECGHSVLHLSSLQSPTGGAERSSPVTAVI